MLLAVGILLCTAPPAALAAGTVYYVAPYGSNAGPGTREAPWATPGYGSKQMQSGDTLIILGGRYALSEWNADIITPPSGGAAAWTVVKGEEGHRPVLAGRDDLYAAVILEGGSYVRVENLEITHDVEPSGAAAHFRGGIAGSGEPASHIVLKDLYIHHIDDMGIDFQDVDDMQVINCRIEYCGSGAVSSPVAEHGGWHDVRLQHCTLSWSGHYYQGGDGSDPPYDRPDGLGIEPAAGPLLIEDCVAEHNYGDGLDSKVANTVIRRCIVANNSCDGIKLWDTGSRVENTLVYGRGDGDEQRTPWAPVVIHTAMPGATFEMVNCTVDDQLGGNYIMAVQYDDPDVRLGLVLKNTIFRQMGEASTGLFVGAGTTLTAENNLFYTPNQDVVLQHGSRLYTSSDIHMLGDGNLYADPRFVRPAWGSSGDYHLRAGSAAIDAASHDAAPPQDLEGRQRDARPDIGAYEYWRPSAWVWLPMILKAWR